MKKFFSVVLSVCLLLALVVIPTNAGYVYEHDKSNNFSYEINFEEGSHTMYYAHWQGLITWKVNREYSYSYYPAGYGNPGIAANPLKGQGDEGVSNTSVYALRIVRAANQSWAESGGYVMNVSTAEGYAPILLQDGVKYRISFDYYVASNYVREQFKTTDGAMYTNSGEDKITIGYGYSVSGTTNAVQTPLVQLDKIYSYNKSNQQQNQFKGDNGQTRNIGNWYHAEYEFTPNFAADGLTEFNYNGTGDVTAETGAPFLIMYHTFRYGADVYFDNIQVSQEVKVNVNPMCDKNEVTGTGYTSGFCGEEIKINNSVVRDGFVVEGWYYDGAYTRPVENNVFSADMHEKTIYPKWRRLVGGSKYSYTNTFENVSSVTSGNTSYFSIQSLSSPTPPSGTKVVQYKYSKKSFEITSSARTGDKNRFLVTTINSLAANKNYRISFKYYLSSGNGVTVYPAFTESSSYSSSNVKSYDSKTLSGNGSWKEETFTVKVTDAKKNLWLHIHANENVNTEVYIDDVKVEEFATLTVNAGEGTINGKQTDTVDIDYGTPLDMLNLKNGDKIIKGFYKDSAFTQKVTTFDGSFSVVYVQWTDVDELENYKYSETLKNAEYSREFSNSGRYAIKATATYNNNAAFGVKKAEKKATYVVSFKYFAPAGTKAKISAGTIEFDGNYTPTIYSDYSVEINGASGVEVLEEGKTEWKTATVAYTENAAKTSNIVTALFVTQLSRGGESNVYIDDITVTKIESTQGFIIFDSMSETKNSVAVIGNLQSSFTTPSEVIFDGYELDGLYKDTGFNSLFTDTVIKGKTKVYVALWRKDGALNVADYAMAKQYVLGMVSLKPTIADMNGDGAVTAADLILLRKEINK